MRVYFGAHSTGKTTMARYTSQQYGLSLITEVARLLLAEKELTLRSLRSDIQVVNAYQRGIMERQLTAESNLDHFVSDRSFDNLAYAAMHATVLKQMIENQSLENYIKTLRENDVAIFFIRPSKHLLVNDGVRETVEWDDLIRIDAMIKFMLEMWGLRHFQIDTPSMQERMRAVDSVVGLMIRSEKTQ